MSRSLEHRNATRRILRLAKGLLGADLVVLCQWVREDTARVLGTVPDILPAKVVSLSRDRIRESGGFLLETQQPLSLLSTAVVAHLDGDPRAALGVSLGPGDSGTEKGLLAVWTGPDGPSAPCLERTGEDLKAALAEVLEAPQEELVLSEMAARFGAVLQATPQAIIFVDEHSGNGLVNGPAAELLEVSSGDVPAQQIAAAMQALRERTKNRQQVEELAAALLPNPEFQIRNWLWEYDAPEARYLEVTSQPVAAGHVRGRIWVLNDVTTARKAAERVSQTLESISDAFFSLDHDWRFTYVNEAAGRLLQRSCSDLLGRDMWEAFPDAVGTPFERQYRSAVELGVTVEFEEYYRPLGIWFAVHAYPSESGLSVYFQDISDRKQAEAKQIASEARYRRLAINVPEAVYEVDVAGHFTEINPAAERILERSAEEVLGAHYDTVIAPQDLDRVEEIFQGVIAGRTDNVPFEARVRRPSGEERLLAITATAIREGDEITGLHGIARDVSEEREAERTLRESEERFRQIAENVREVFWIFTPDFSQTLYLSPTYEAATGRSLEAVYRDSRDFLAPVHPDDLPGLLTAMERIRLEPIEVEFRLRHADGSERWFLARGYPVRDQDGAVYRVVGTSEDITERRRAEEALRASERRLQQILDALPVGVILADATGQLVWHNPAGQRIWGGLRMVGLERYGEYRGWWAETGERIRGEEWALARALRGEDVPGEVVDIEGFDGARRTTLTSAAPLLDEADSVVGAVVVQEDITDARAKDAQQRLLAAALEGLREGVCLLTPERELIYANEAFTRMLGIDPARIPGLRMDAFAPDAETAAQQQENVRTALQQGRWSGRIRRPRLSDGVEVPIDIVLGRLDEGGPGAGLLYGVAQDASELIQREQQLRRAERLASVGTLVGGVAHELNNPLGAVLNFTQLMLLDVRNEADTEALTIIHRESARMAKIVSDLKQIARDSQADISEKSPVDLNEVVRHVLKVQDYRLSTSNIEVRKDLAEDLPKVLGDRGALEQVVLNLIVNAEQAMAVQSERGLLILRTRASASGAVLHVVDNGPGIPINQLDRIWDPFFTTKATGEGTGLGLSLVHSIVTEHDGEIRVESQVGKGTAFRLNLPGTKETHTESVPVRIADAAARPLRILVVDDEEAVRVVTMRYLRRRGHQVEEAAEGRAALKMLDHASYDVILSDLRMPGLGGEAMMERLEERSLSHKLVFLTGDASGLGARLERAGVPVLLKPAKLEDVARAVEAIGYRGE